MANGQRLVFITAAGALLPVIIHAVISPPADSVLYLQLILYALIITTLYIVSRRRKDKTALVFMGWSGIKIFVWAAYFFWYFSQGHGIKTAGTKLLLIDFALMYVAGLVFEVWFAVERAR